MSLELKDLYWLAGLMEGEGCFYTPKPGTKGRSIALMLGMTDRDVVERAADILGAKLQAPRFVKGATKNSYYIALSGKKAAGWMMTLYTLMGQRRRAKIKECLDFFKSKTHMGPDTQTHCKVGHEFTPDNSYFWESKGRKGRFCRTCNQERGRRWDKANPGKRAEYNRRNLEKRRLARLSSKPASASAAKQINGNEESSIHVVPVKSLH
jgi:hypothetical protein